MKPEWLERSVILHTRLCLCLTEPDFKKVMKSLNNPSDTGRWITEDRHATCHLVENSEDILQCIVMCLDAKDAVDPTVFLALIAHEVTHVIQEMQYWGVIDKVELPALSHQACFQRVIDEYCRQTNTEVVFKQLPAKKKTKKKGKR